VTKAKCAYEIYIQATPQQIWSALTDPEMTKQYWSRHRNVSSWIPGASWQHQDYDDSSIVDLTGIVVESTAPRRLVLTWAFPSDAGIAERTSRVSFELEPFGEGAVCLTVRHEDLEPDSPMLDGVTKGWPIVLSSLKTLLETGQPMPLTASRWREPPR
jgi:uncharacterized protein YndB with AHSA1/START domain